jgi:sugar-specific transcriptional regulator TrmB
MWKIAVNAELKIEEILTGVAPYLIKAGYGWENISERYIQMLNNAQHQIAIMTSTANGLIRLKKEAMEALAQANVKRHVAIRVLTQLSKENAKTAIEVANFAEVRVTTPQYAYMHIADRNEAIIGEIAKDTYDNATATGNATWIRSMAVVNTLYRSFEALWKDSKPLDEGITEIKNTLKQ